MELAKKFVFEKEPAYEKCRFPKGSPREKILEHQRETFLCQAFFPRRGGFPWFFKRKRTKLKLKNFIL